MYGPYMTVAEIEAKYPNQFILIGNPTLSRYHEVRGGYVVLRAADRDEFYRRFEEWSGDPTIKHLASWYTGKDTSGIGEVLPPDAEPGVA